MFETFLALLPGLPVEAVFHEVVNHLDGDLDNGELEFDSFHFFLQVGIEEVFSRLLDGLDCLF